MQINKVLLLHIPQNPQSETSFIQVAPLGLVGMAHYIKDQLNIEVSIINAGSFIMSLPDVAVSEYVLEKNFDLIMLDLHWHQQLFDVLQVIDTLKTDSNYIAVGGITASAFGSELLAKNTNIDFLIKGEGEVPAVKLIKAINEKLDFHDVPNLIWRNEDQLILENMTEFLADSIFLNNLNDWDLTIYDSLAPYIGKIRRNQGALDFFFVPIGRGCMEECSYCAGSNSSFKKCFNRKYVTYRSPEAVAKTIINVHRKHCFNNFYICYDVKEIPEQWWIDLFQLISDAKIDIGLYFEAYRIPSHRFVTSFMAAFQNSKSQIILSPGCFSDNARYKYTSVRYTLDELYNFLVFVNNRLPICIYFSLIPDSEEVAVENIILNIRWCQKIMNCFWNTAIFVSPIIMEPNAPWDNEPAKYGIEKEVAGLNDFIDNSNLHNKSNMDLGYKFNHNRLITLIYYGITNKLSLSDIDIDRTIIINSVSDMECLNNDLSDKIIIINAETYDEFIYALFRYKNKFSTVEKLIFRKTIAVREVLNSTGGACFENMSFISIPLRYAIRSRDCVAYKEGVNSNKTIKNLLFYKPFFDNFKYHLLAYGICDDGIVYIPNAAPNKLFPLYIQIDAQKNYFVASKNGYLFKEVSFASFKTLCDQLNFDNICQINL